jgi:hypothetical protein
MGNDCRFRDWCCINENNFIEDQCQEFQSLGKVRNDDDSTGKGDLRFLDFAHSAYGKYRFSVLEFFTVNVDHGLSAVTISVCSKTLRYFVSMFRLTANLEGLYESTWKSAFGQALKWSLIEIVGSQLKYPIVSDRAIDQTLDNNLLQ